MHPDIERLIILAKESGELTDKQKGIILRKAEKLGEDVDEVEIKLASLMTHKKGNNEKKRCPNCGAIIPGFSLRCPECGYIFQHENENSAENRAAFSVLQKSLQNTRGPKEKAAIINSFVIPNTKESLIQLLIMAYSNYDTGRDVEDEVVRRSWLSKAVHAYQLLKAQAKDDVDVAKLLEKYKILDDKRAIAKLTGQGRKLAVRLSFAIAFIIIAVVFYLHTTSDIREYIHTVKIFKTLVLQSDERNVESKLKALVADGKVELLELFTTEGGSNNGGIVRYEYTSNGYSKYYLLQDDYNLFSKLEVFDEKETLKQILSRDKENIFYTHLHLVPIPFLWLPASETDIMINNSNLFWDLSQNNLFLGGNIIRTDYDEQGKLRKVTSDENLSIVFDYNANAELIFAKIFSRYGDVMKFYFIWANQRLVKIEREDLNPETDSFALHNKLELSYDSRDNLKVVELLGFNNEGKSTYSRKVFYTYEGQFVYSKYGRKEHIYYCDKNGNPIYGIRIVRPEQSDVSPWQIK